MQKPIVVVGSLNLDLVARVDRLPAEGETLTGINFHTYYGGKGANQAVALARLGAPVKMLGKLGSDGFADQLRAGLVDAGVDVTQLGTAPGSSGTALITTSAEGSNTIVVIPGANGAVRPEDIDQLRDTIAQSEMVLGQLEIPLESMVRLGEVVREVRVPFLLDPAPAVRLPLDLLRSVTWFTPNETETQILLGGNEVRGLHAASESADRLLKLGVRNVILKMGADGVYLAGADVEWTHIPAFPVNAVDTTAAGDAFNGAFAFALGCRKMDPVRAAEFACAVAALSVTRAGAQTSMPKLDEVEAFLSEQAEGAGRL